MKYFKITRTWSVKAADEAEAVHLVATDPDKYLESETVRFSQQAMRSGSRARRG